MVFNFLSFSQCLMKVAIPHLQAAMTCSIAANSISVPISCQVLSTADGLAFANQLQQAKERSILLTAAEFLASRLSNEFIII